MENLPSSAHEPLLSHFHKKNYPFGTECHSIKSGLHNVFFLYFLEKIARLNLFKFSTSKVKCTLNQERNM